MSDKSPEDGAREEIDEILQSVGWTYLGRHKTELAVGEDATGYIEEYPTDDGPVDYGLIIDGELHSILEAKKQSANVTGQFQQIKRYAAAVDTPHAVDDKIGLTVGFAGVGDEFCRYDFREYGLNTTTFISFYTPAELQSLVERDYHAAVSHLTSTQPVDIDPQLWDHQRDAVRGVEQSLADGVPRSLIRITTGAGKTRSAMALSARLLKSGYADNILYIPDSRGISDQVKTDYIEYDPLGISNSFSDNYIVEDLQDNVSHRLENANVVVTTLQKMYEIAQDDPSRLSAGKFDVIITDECHRSIYNSDGYGQVLDQIDAVEVGLTATPTKKTVQRFNDNRVVDYGYNQALIDDHVVPYEANQIKTKITMNGVERDSEYYPAKDLGRKFSVPDTHRKAAETIYDEIDEKTELTLIFAVSDPHATEIVHDLRQAGPFANERPEFIQKITYNVDAPEQTLKNFKDPYSPPYIAVTVEKIEAGIDIRPLENVVMLRPVKSPVLFNQMVGRGTRTYDDKDKFRLFDFVGVLDYFDYLPPFGTEDHEREEVIRGESEVSDETDQSDEFKIINEPDEVVMSKRYFQLEGIDGKITGKEYRQQFVFDVQKRATEIDNILRSAGTVTDAKESVLDVLAEESGHYVPLHVLQVFINEYHYETSSDTPNAVLLLSIINDLLYGYYPDFDDRLNYTRRQLREQNELNDVENEYLNGFIDVAKPPNGIKISQLRHPPLSNIGGVKRARESFSSMKLRAFVDRFRSLLSDPVDSELQNPKGHRYNIAEDFNLSEDELQDLLDTLNNSGVLESARENRVSKRSTDYTLYDSIVGPNIAETSKRGKTLDLKDILAAIVTGIADPPLGMIYFGISIAISNTINSETLSKREAFGYSAIWRLGDKQVNNEVSYSTATETIVQASTYVDDSYLLDISNPDEVISSLEEKNVIHENERMDGMALTLNDKLNVGWDLSNYLSDDVPSDIFEK